MSSQGCTAKITLDFVGAFTDAEKHEAIHDPAKPYAPADGPNNFKGFERADDGNVKTAEYFKEEQDTGSGLRYMINKQAPSSTIRQLEQSALSCIPE